MMDSVTMENFRCFRERQTVPLAPLTLLVGENSTGKTSFLAMLHVLAQLQNSLTNPDFKEPPYDLGSFYEIAYDSGGEGPQTEEFTIGLEQHDRRISRPRQTGSYCDMFTFRKNNFTPELFRHTRSVGDVVVDEEVDKDERYRATLRNDVGSWSVDGPARPHGRTQFGQYRFLLDLSRTSLRHRDDSDGVSRPIPVDGGPDWDDKYAEQFLRITRDWLFSRVRSRRTFASAPVRSNPRRTYDPARLDPDPQGDYMPMYVADLFSQREGAWQTLKQRLENFGQEAGLFDELSIRQLGTHGGDPFQIQVRQADGDKGHTMRNLADVGYGVSQVLPVITELLRPNHADQFLLQQPEVHLHPSAQAALGTLFCQAAATRRQLIVETHSDHLIDRVRMDVRDGKTDLGVEDVRILYFERSGLEVKIHELWWDEHGNIENAPQGYRRFFMEEVERSIWPPS